MSFEEELRLALRRTAESLEPPAWPSAQIRARARRQRRQVRGRALAAAVATAVAVVVPVAATGVLRTGTQVVPGAGAVGPAGAGRTGGGTAPASPPGVPSGSPSGAVSGPPSGSGPGSGLQSGSGSGALPVQVVPSGRRVQVGHGVWLTLTGAQMCVGGKDGGGCNSAVAGNQASGTVGWRTDGDSKGTLYVPLYIGPGRVARMSMKVGATVYPVTVVSLAGQPGYAGGYVWTPVSGSAGASTASATATVYDAVGHVLATFTWP
ncbi:hypothetical protein GXW83_18330 [Streptacidiphilus sp. PB12-B1b]|uniref:hypothetical protein n=1 Tax=Streptacidiphilus sp. PB12-B1b TaxID=2705012 RepID=UPI0015FB7F6B|nr:hypothetical protein [Streptacidiphilus sp. PB12-B1b]QMU77365.1 hypothetical protein GXW83_18330 [Streptacidiphilus sp. PB12-B1b]